MTKYVRFSDRDPGALRYRLKQVNEIIDKWNKSNWPWGLHPEECDIMYEEMMKIKRLSEIE